MRVVAAASLLLVAGAEARDLRGARADAAPKTPDPALMTPKFKTIPFEDALSALKQKAQEEPSAVSLIEGVLDNVLGDLKIAAKPAMTDSANPTHVPNPKTETSPPKRRGLNERQSSNECDNPSITVEWNSLSDTDKSNYVAAIKCLQGKPSRSGLSGAQTLWDDFAAIHQQMNTQIHGVGQFLPWHRYFLYIFENELRTTCGYSGSMTWWDETKNAGNFNGAAPFTNDYYGSMPDGDAVCIEDGEFGGLTLHVGPGGGESDHCLARGCSESDSASVTSSYVNSCNSYNDYNDMQSCHDFGPHAYGHNAIGGVMGDVQGSVGDPAFFLHHAFVDRNWRIWQRTDPLERTYMIGGSATQNCDSCAQTTLDYQLNMLGFYDTITADQVMDTEGGFLCYHYDY